MCSCIGHRKCDACIIREASAFNFNKCREDWKNNAKEKPKKPNVNAYIMTIRTGRD